MHVCRNCRTLFMEERAASGAGMIRGTIPGPFEGVSRPFAGSSQTDTARVFATSALPDVDESDDEDSEDRYDYLRELPGPGEVQFVAWLDNKVVTTGSY